MNAWNVGSASDVVVELRARPGDSTSTSNDRSLVELHARPVGSAR